MKYLIIALALFGTEILPADFEHVKYTCMCSCYDYQQRPVRMRIEGGGYTYQYLHMPLINPATRYAEFALRHVSDARGCSVQRGAACAGLRSYGDTTISPGWTDRCRWTFDPES